MLYDADLNTLLSITFDATDAGVNDWMSRDRLIDSPYTDIMTSQVGISVHG